MSTKIEIGYYAFEGGKFSSDPNAYLNCQGVVAWLNPDSSASEGKRGLILIPDAERFMWAKVSTEIGAQCEYGGKSNTQKILDYAEKYKLNFPAAQWCASYSKNGIKPGEAFLPAQGQWWNMLDNLKIINSALDKMGGALLTNVVCSSTECSSNLVWCMDMDDLYALKESKRSYFTVRAVIAF